MRIPSLLLLTTLFGACAEGGQEDRPASAVLLAANHHMFSFRGLPNLSQVQVQPEEIFTDQAIWTLADNGTWTVTRPSGTSAPQVYALETTGELTVILPVVDPSLPTPVFRGAYGLAGDTGLFFFADRLITQDSRSLGLFWGSRVDPAALDLAGDWHLFSLHVLFSSSAVPDPDEIARAVAGSVTAAAAAAGAPHALSGTGAESSGAAQELSGSIQDLGDGEVNLTVTYQRDGQPQTADDRVFVAAHGAGAILAADRDESDGEAGLLAMMRKRSIAIDPDALAGEYLIGAHTVFVNPTNPGSDAALGVLTLTAGGAFRIAMTGSRGIDFVYQGTFTADDDGLLTLTVDNTGETWSGAVDADDRTLVILDHVIEQRANNTPELNLFFALRKAVN